MKKNKIKDADFREMDFREIKKYIYKSAYSKGERSKEKSCQYRGGKNSDRFCRMTTNTSCGGCRFYSPSTIEVFKVTYEEVVNAKEVYEQSIEAEKKLEGMYIDMYTCITEAREMMDKIRDIYKKLYITAWQDSVNSYE